MAEPVIITCPLWDALCTVSTSLPETPRWKFTREVGKSYIFSLEAKLFALRYHFFFPEKEKKKYCDFLLSSFFFLFFFRRNRISRLIEGHTKDHKGKKDTRNGRTSLLESIRIVRVVYRWKKKKKEKNEIKKEKKRKDKDKDEKYVLHGV